MAHKKISVIIFGNGDSLKKALIVNILGKDLSELTNKQHPENTEIYENKTYEFICAPNLGKQFSYIPFRSKNPPPDMHLVVVEEGFSEDDVWQQIDDLSKKTGKPTQEFTVVLPLSYKQGEYIFKSCTMQQLFSDLDNLTAHRRLTLTSSRHGDNFGSWNKMQSKGKHTSLKVNLFLLGMSGTGKSASGNTILGEKVFMSKPSSMAITTECQVAETEINGTHFSVIDTPDIFDDDIEASVWDKHVKRCRDLCESGPSVFVLVMHVSRFTDGERDVLRKLEKAFGSKAREQTVILFTRGNDLQQAGMKFADFLHSCQPDLKEIIKKCGNRCVLFENHNSESQVEKLIQTVIKMIQEEQK